MEQLESRNLLALILTFDGNSGSSVMVQENGMAPDNVAVTEANDIITIDLKGGNFDISSSPANGLLSYDGANPGASTKAFIDLSGAGASISSISVLFSPDTDDQLSLQLEAGSKVGDTSVFNDGGSQVPHVTFDSVTINAIDIGATGGSGQYVVTDAELDRITTTDHVRIGQADVGTIVFTGPVSMASADFLQVASGVGINDTGSSDVYTDATLELLTTGGGVGMTSPFNIAATNLAAGIGSGNLNVANSGDVTIKQLGSGGSTFTAASGSVTLVAQGTITLDASASNIGAGGGAILLHAAGASSDIVLNSLVSQAATSDGISIRADRSITGRPDQSM